MIFRNTKPEIAISCRESGKNIWRHFRTYCLIFSSIFFLSEREFFLNAAEPISQQENNPGQALAEQLRSRAPEENSEIGAVLKIRSKNKKMIEVPVVCKIVVGTNYWDAIYETAATAQMGAEKLIVRHFPTAPNQYFYARAENSSVPLPELESLSPAEATIPLAGSDFWLTDLGLDFLHWPEQRRLNGELRLNQPCYVLESSNPTGEEIVRVKSWIDKKSNGILVAEAYNRKKQKVKEFSLSGSSFKKIKGQWQLEKMDIHNAKTGSQTTLKFNLSK